METSRRLWLKKIGIGVASIGLSQLDSLSSFEISKNHDSILDINSDEIILQANENPFGPSPMARKVFLENSAISNRYNWNTSSDLISEIAKINKVSEENILLGAGSTEILDLVAKFVSQEKGNYILPFPTYDYWSVILDNLGLDKKYIPVTTDKKIDLDAMQKSINSDTKLVYLCNPNNPTGTICDRNNLVDFITIIPKDILILVDEAYLEYTNQQSLSNLIDEHSNLIITKTFSKIYGLAGARIGYALADKTTIEKLITFQSSPNNSVSVLSRLAASASLKDFKFIADCRLHNDEAKKYTMQELKKINLNCIPSATNFIYFSTENYKKNYFEQLEKHQIVGTRIYEEKGKWTRISIGTLKEMTQFIKALQ